jgi:hypothetical protein
MMPIEDYFYDTEFLEDGPDYPIELISLGVKRRRDGRLYYAVSSEFDLHRAWHHGGPSGDFWLRNNVLNQLPLVMRDPHTIWLDGSGTPMLDHQHPAVKTRNEIVQDLIELFELGVEMKRRLWAWYADYDHVVLSQLWGTMVQLPYGMPMFTHDLKQVVDLAGNPAMPKQAEGEHNALHDAEHVSTMFNHCIDLGLIPTRWSPVGVPVKPRPIRDNPQA